MTTVSTIPHIVSRSFTSVDDFWRVRNLLIETYPLVATGFNWEIRRWDGWYTHREDQQETIDLCREVRLWETGEGQLIGAAFPENHGSAEVHLQLHPDYRENIEKPMLIWAEEHLCKVNEAGQHHLSIYVNDYDVPRIRILEKRGYEKTQWWGMVRRMRLGNKPLPQPVIAGGYTMRCTQPDDADHQRIADVLNAGFNRTMHTAGEFRNFSEHSPSFQHDLHLVAVAPDGSFASFVGITYDAGNRRGIFEPVCTHPAHLRKGLARSLMIEGLHRLKALGAADVYVETGDMIPANGLYDSVGFAEAYRGFLWHRVF